jgi:eukaryotic-like serine/threonine-protein kinase
MNERKKTVEALFEGALGLTAPGQRAEYLDRECGGDTALREEVEGLLRAAERAGGFLAADTANQASGTARVHLPPLQRPGDRIGRYKLLQQIGEGGCGVVYMAEQEEPVRRRVALKVIKLGMDTRQVIARFEAERQALALMDHPNIAKVLDAGATETGRPYFVMELVRGIKITNFCDDQKLSTADRLKLFVQVCQAIQHAHQKGIIHRDLKPSNILVTVNDGVPVPKVIDFGIAKATTGQPLTDKTLFTAFEQFIGTPAYMSPEQAVMTSLDVDTRSDVYSLGVLLYELLTGRTPFDQKVLLAAGLDAMRRTILEQEPPRPSIQLNSLVAEELTTTAQCRHTDAPRLLHEVCGDLDWIVMKCLEKDRMRRYETANGLAADLTRHLNDEPVVARPPSRIYEFQKTVRRHKFGFAAAAAILLVLAGGITLTTWQAVRATRAERSANRARAEAEKARQNEGGLRQAAQTEADRAEASGMEAKRTLSAADFLQAARLIAEDNANDALPYLARSLSFNPANDAAMTRLATLLAYRTWWLPTLILKHGGRVNSAEYSPDGKRIVTVSADGTARIWDARTGQPLVEPMKHPFSVTSAQFSPDEKRIVTVSDDMTTRVWEAQTGQPVTEPIKHGSRVMSVQFSPDGKRIVTGSGDNQARVWDADTGRPLTEPLVHDNDLKKQEEDAAKASGTVVSDNAIIVSMSVDGRTMVYPSITKPVRAQFSRDGERIVTASEGGTARVWDVQTGNPVTEPMKHGSAVISGQFSPDGKRIVTVARDNKERFWDTQTGQLLEEHVNRSSLPNPKEVSLDGKRILTASSDNAARVWEAQTGPAVPFRWPFPLMHGGSGHGQYSRPQFSHDGRRIVMPTVDKTALVWEAATGRALASLPHNSEVLTACFSPDDRRIVTTARDRTARVWDAQTGRPLSEPMNHESDLFSAKFSPDGRLIATECVEKARSFGNEYSPRFSPDGKRILVTRGITRLWDAQTGRPLTEPIEGAGRPPPISPGTRWAIAGVLDTQTGQPVIEPMMHRGNVTSAQFSPDGKRIVTGSSDTTARVWEAQNGRPLTEPMNHGAPVLMTRFSPDGKQVLSVSEKAARIWDAETGQPLTQPVTVGVPGVHSAEFSPDGKRIVIASGDSRTRVWDALTGQPLTEPINNGYQLFHVEFCLEFSPDGKRILTVAADAVPSGGLTEKPLVWDVAPSQSPCPGWLLQLAEAISGKVLNKEGVLEPTRLNRVETLNQIRQKLAGQPDDDWVVWGRWLLADRATRTISPFAKITVPEYIERLIQEKAAPSLDEAEQLAAGMPEVLRQVSKARDALKPAGQERKSQTTASQPAAGTNDATNRERVKP